MVHYFQTNPYAELMFFFGGDWNMTGLIFHFIYGIIMDNHG